MVGFNHVYGTYSKIQYKRLELAVFTPKALSCTMQVCTTQLQQYWKDKCGSVASNAEKLAKPITRATCAYICMCA